MRKRTQALDTIGNLGLTTFDVCIIGSGAGGATAAHVLTAAGRKVLVLEAGPLLHRHLDDPRRDPEPLHSNDELKYEVRGVIAHDTVLEPRTFRKTDATDAAIHPDVNVLPKLVGGAFMHADCVSPRFTAVDFRLRSAMDDLLGNTPTLAVPGFGVDSGSANFADWPFSYDALEPFYAEAEDLYGVAGQDDNPYAPPRSRPYPMPPGLPMYLTELLAEGCRQTTVDPFGPLTPHRAPVAINSRFRDERPPCVECGPCSGYGCPNNAKGGPAVVTLRKALLSGNCQLRFNCQVTRLDNDGGSVTGVAYIDGQGDPQTATASAYILAASAIESARLCFLSPTPTDGVLGNSSDQVGRNLMFHLQTNVNGFLPNRVHGDRGKAVTGLLSDFRGVTPGGGGIRVFDVASTPTVALGGVCEFSASQGNPITEDGTNYAFSLGYRRGMRLKNVMRDRPIGHHLFGLLMQAEDAPQRTNRIDLDPNVIDVFGRPVPRVTYRNHAFELQARDFYIPFMKTIVQNAGSAVAFAVPCDALLSGPQASRHVLGTLRMGNDPANSVLNADGRFHDVENLYACDGSTFVTSSGWNPTLTIIAVALKIAHGIAGTTPT